MADNKDLLDTFKNRRRYLRSQITRLCNKIENQLQTEDNVSKDYRQRLEALRNNLDDTNLNIHEVIPEDEETQQLFDEEEAYSERITEVLSLLDNEPTLTSADSSFDNRSKLKLPTVSMPVFSNDKNESLERFLHAFESIIKKHKLSDYEKFIYLKGQLNKGPKALVNSLDVNDQAYSIAKDLLIEAFASPVTQKYDCIKRLTNLKLTSSADVYEYISDIRSIISNVKVLNIDVNTIMQYFIWNSMDSLFQSELIQITNCSKPDLDKIMTNIFPATERYIKACENARGKYNIGNATSRAIETNNFAVKTKSNSFRPCLLCVSDKNNNVTHTLRDCTVYKDPRHKVKRLEYYNFCSKCSFTNHISKNCRFKFPSPCKHCKGSHLTFLCLKNEISSSATNSKLSSVHFNSTVKYDSIMLPTFTVNVNDERVRVLKDSGSQRNFITKILAERLKLEVVKPNFEITISGFNSRKTISTDIVLLPLNISGSLVHVEAVTVPTIDLNFDIKNLSLVAKNFSNKGYMLADQCLMSDVDAPIELIMGPDADKLLCPATNIYGSGPTSSAYLSTKIGVIIIGNVKDILNNVKCLPKLNNDRDDCNDTVLKLQYSVENNSSTEYSVERVIDVLDDNNDIIHSKLEEACIDALEQQGSSLLNYDDDSANDDESNELNSLIVDEIMTNTYRNSDGRLVMPLPWNSKCKDNLGTNFNISKKILSSNLQKLKSKDQLLQYDRVFREQEEMGIVQRIDDVDLYREQYKDCSFLPHMGIFRENKETTKLRIVYLSNLCEKSRHQPCAVSHNEALLPGPCLNSKLLTSLMLSRFDLYILIFDIAKAFLSIELPEEDQRKLLCLWYKDVANGDYSLIAYKNVRLSFGLRPSPTILMLALYKILLNEDEEDEQVKYLKKLIYNNIYMDNGLVSSNNAEEISLYYRLLPTIFEEYKFTLQQFATNEPNLQSSIDSDNCESNISFFGINWDRINDKLSPLPINLDRSASTKRKILSNLNAVYDLFGVYSPMMLRAKLFFHKLQMQTSTGWDDQLPDDTLDEWRKICKQVNGIPPVALDRYVGARDGEYDLVAYCDASSVAYGVVVYIIDVATRKVSFLQAKNRLINTKLSKKTIPSLECQAIVFAVEILTDLYRELSSDRNVLPVNIKDLIIYTDSMVCISWIKSYFMKFDKMQKRSIFVQNRLKQIDRMCANNSFSFRYIEGKQNPADFLTRPTSYNMLMGTNFFSGPDYDCITNQPDIEVSVPITDEFCVTTACRSNNLLATTDLESKEHLLDVTKFSSFNKLVNIHKYVIKFIHKLKQKVAIKKDSYLPDMHDYDCRSAAVNQLIRTEQHKFFPDLFEFFDARKVPIGKIPNLVLQLNLFIDNDSIIRVKGKFGTGSYNPILLPSKSYLSEMIIRELHVLFSHVGVYTVLRELRKQFWILKGFSTVRRIIKSCVICKKVNARPIKLNQSNYRQFRSDPPRTPFSSIFIDYIGPIMVKFNGANKKVYLLIITCLWSRAISLKICHSADTLEFIRTLQMHIFECGLFQLCLSDLGSQITSGTNLISKLLEEDETKLFLSNNGISSVKFENYPKGNSALGSLVETLVKQVKNLVRKSVGKLILDFPQFELLVAKSVHIINRRPVAFTEGIRTTDSKEDFPDPITPEMLVYGRELISLNILPPLIENDNYDPRCAELSDYSANLEKLKSAHDRLIEIYSREFLVNLMYQAVDEKSKYKPVYHNKVKPGDIVLLIEPCTKRGNFPLGIIKTVNTNTLDEVVSATVLKGKSREVVYRHASSIIPLLEGNEEITDNPDIVTNEERVTRPIRKAAILARDKINAALY